MRQLSQLQSNNIFLFLQCYKNTKLSLYSVVTSKLNFIYLHICLSTYDFKIYGDFQSSSNHTNTYSMLNYLIVHDYIREKKNKFKSPKITVAGDSGSFFFVNRSFINIQFKTY